VIQTFRQKVFLLLEVIKQYPSNPVSVRPLKPGSLSPYRVNFHKVYDLTEQVLPEDTDTTLPNPEEYARFLITRHLQANGLGQPSEIAYLLKNIKPLVSATLQDLVFNGELLQISAGGNSYYALPASLELLDKSLERAVELAQSICELPQSAYILTGKRLCGVLANHRDR